jgi:L-2,4-diaminobutyrate decarboxylase
MEDSSFQVDMNALEDALRTLVLKPSVPVTGLNIPLEIPRDGVGEKAVLDLLAPEVLGGASYLDAPQAFAHMDPPTPWLTWVVTLWNARLNQNLLHLATAPVARSLEERVISWLAPFFGMDGGHLVPGSTVANLTALWVARDLRGISEVVAPDTAHVSIEKAARLLGLPMRKLPTDETGRLKSEFATNLRRSCLVLAAGSTSTGMIDPLDLSGKALWTHVDAAWAGPLRLSTRHAALLNGIENADSISISGHKWLFQPKESALILFRETRKSHAAISFQGPYMAAANIGLLGSHGAMAVPLLALLWAWGSSGLEQRLNRCMESAERFASFVKEDPRLHLLAWPATGVVVWRPRQKSLQEVAALLPAGLASQTTLNGETWFRCVSANPNVEIDVVIAAVRSAIADGTNT